jgi:ribonuclease Z
MPGLVYDQGGLRVTAFENDHGDRVKPSYGYKFEFGGHKVVPAGDTRYSVNVVREATGADLLVHPVTLIPEAPLAGNPSYPAIYDHLASPEQAARVFAEAHPKLAVFSHIGLNGNSTVEDLLRATRRVYDGPLVAGEDLMSFEIGAEVIQHEREP